MDKYIQVLILTIIPCIIFFSILLVSIILFKKYVYRKHKDFEEMLNNDETKDKALLILNKRENISKRANIVFNYCIPIFGFLCFLLGIYMFLIDGIKLIEDIKYLIIILMGIYFLFIGIKELILNYYFYKYLVQIDEIYNILLVKGKDKLYGTIKINNINKYTIYVSWYIYDEQKNNICGKSDNIYIKERIKEKIIEKIINKINKYRIGRVKYFKDYNITIS
jgi:hypothetical protein